MGSISETYDAVVVGSGFGGAFAAYGLVHAGARVLMLERGEWVSRGAHNWAPQGALELTPYYETNTAWRMKGEAEGPLGAVRCVGGMSVFYGGVSLRLRESDFAGRGDRDTAMGAAFPYDYDELKPYYARVERILGVRGGAGDPVAPPRDVPRTRAGDPLSRPSKRIADAARDLGLTPFRLPLAIHTGNGNGNGNGRQGCIHCLTCDTFACAIGAKNDTATAVLPALMTKGLTLRTGTAAVRVLVDGDRATGVECVHVDSGRRYTVRADRVVLAAGALASPHLLLASGLQTRSPAARAVGRYLTRHCNGIVFGFFPRTPNPRGRFHKQVGIHDYYAESESHGRSGAIQQVHSPPIGLAQEHVPRWLHWLLPHVIRRMTGLLIMGEDEPRHGNGVRLDPAVTDALGMPGLIVHHSYVQSELRARDELARHARAILRKAGAWATFLHRISTFSHAMGTLRMGHDSRSAPLDHACRFRGVRNLHVTDASALPGCGAVNPSLTIAANALRAAEHMSTSGSRV